MSTIDNDYVPEAQLEHDNEETIEQEENLSTHIDHMKEIEKLKEESEMPIEELLKIYGVEKVTKEPTIALAHANLEDLDDENDEDYKGEEEEDDEDESSDEDDDEDEDESMNDDDEVATGETNPTTETQ